VALQFEALDAPQDGPQNQIESSRTTEQSGVLSAARPGGTHGDIATASVVVNCIPAILDAPAGLRTSRDLPMCLLPPDALP